MRRTLVAAVLWLWVSVVWGQSEAPRLQTPESAGSQLEAPVTRPVRSAQRYRRFEDDRLPGVERVPVPPPS